MREVDGFNVYVCDCGEEVTYGSTHTHGGNTMSEFYTYMKIPAAELLPGDHMMDETYIDLLGQEITKVRLPEAPVVVVAFEIGTTTCYAGKDAVLGVCRPMDAAQVKALMDALTKGEAA